MAKNFQRPKSNVMRTTRIVTSLDQRREDFCQLITRNALYEAVHIATKARGIFCTDGQILGH